MSLPLNPLMRRLALLPLLIASCGAPLVQTGPTLDADGLPLDWPARPEVQGPIASQWPAEERLLIGSPELGKGVQVHVVARHDSPAVFLRWVIPGGRALEMTGKDGKIAARWPEGAVELAAELAPMGTRALPGAAFATQVANIGAQIDLIALPDAVIVDVHVLSHRLPQALELLKEVLVTPELDGAQLESLKQRHHADLANEAQEPAAVADRLARRLIFGPMHPYGSLGMTLESVTKVTRKQVQEAAAAAFRLGGSHLIAVGDVDAAGLAEAVQKTFGAAVDQPASAVALPLPASEATARGCHLIALPDASQTAVVLATEAPRRSDPQWPELQVTNQLLGGSASSRLFDALREKRGLGYGASSRLEGRLVGGAWMIAANVRTDATLEALTVIDEQLHKLRQEAPGDGELTNAKRFLAGQFALSLADGDELADLLAVAPLYHLPPEAQAQFLNQVQELPADRVPQVAGRWPELDGTVVVLAGNISALRPAIDARCGRVVEHDAQGKLLRVDVGSDREMSDAARGNAFALWSRGADGLDALARYVAKPSHLARYRAQALAVLGASANSGKVLAIGRKAPDWPDELDLQVLGRLSSLDGLLLLLNLHASLEAHDAVAAQLATMQTIRHDIAEMPAPKLAAMFERLDPLLESLLGMHNADDRWWAAELLVTYRGLDGLRRVLSEIAVDDHYQKPQWHTVDPKKALAHLARDVIAPMGPQKLQPLLLATLVRNQPMGKVIAITVLKALADDASIQALKTLADESDVAALLDLPGPLSVHELALAAADVCKYFAEVAASERAGKLDAASAEKHRAAAFATFDLTDKRLRAEVNRVVSGAPPAAPESVPETGTPAPVAP